MLGLDLHPADSFPADDTGYGFDNIGDVLSLPPVLLEKYLIAAEETVEVAVQSADLRSRLLHPAPDDVVPSTFRKLHARTKARKHARFRRTGSTPSAASH